MNTNTTNDGMDGKYFPSKKRKIDPPELVRKIRGSGKLILKACGMGAVAGLVIAFGTPKEYTASTLIVPEGYSRSSSSRMSALADMAGVGMASPSTAGRDAIYPSLYPAIVHSTPFLVRLFDVEVRERKDSTTMTLSNYLRERQKRPWWSVITSAPSRLTGLAMSLFREEPKVEKAKTGIDIFRLTREEAGMAGAIASRIAVGVDKKKRTITLFVTMQDPLVAATMADTVRECLKEYITEYRTAKARRVLEYAEKLCREAQAEYNKAQEKYTRHADANRGLVRLASRVESVNLRNEMNLALSIYERAERQVQAARARVEKIRPVYAVIQPVVVPLSPSKPRKMVILAVCVLLGGAGSAIWVLFAKDFLIEIKRKRMDCGNRES